MQKLNFIFWGTGPVAESVLYALYKANYIPSLVITKPDSLVGRHQISTPPQIKKWCEMKNIPVYQPEKVELKNLQNSNTKSPLLESYDLSIVASYGNIIPEHILNVPKLGFLNVHPSTLPLYRGPSPIQSALLNGDKVIGVSIMKLDKEMDHGPILIQSKIENKIIDTAQSLELLSGQLGGELLIQILPHYINGNINLIEQDHSKATICKFLEKSQGEIQVKMNLNHTDHHGGKDDFEIIKNKYRALYPWPGIYFYFEHKTKNKEGVEESKKIRVKITKLNLMGTNLDECIEKVIPEGKSEITWEDFKRGYLNN